MPPRRSSCLSLNCRPIWAAHRSSLPSSSLRTSRGSGRRSWPLSSKQVEGEQEHGTILPPVAQPIEARQAIAITGNRFPIEQE